MTARENLSRPVIGAATAVILAVWLFQFSPVLFGGLNLMGYRLLDPRITGAAPLPHKQRLDMELPGRDSSLQVMHVPYQAYLARNFHEGRFPLWNPEMGCGQPVASDPQYKPFNPFFWPYFAWPSAWMFSVCIALMALWGMLGFALYLRELGLAWQAAVVGGLLLAWNPLTQQMLVLSAPWAMWSFAWALWGVERWAKGHRLGFAVAAAASAVMVYAGHPVVAAFYFLILLTYLLVRPMERSRGERLAAAAGLAGGLLVLAACHLVPFAAGFHEYASYKAAWDGGPRNQWWELSNPRSLIYVPLPVWGLAFTGLVSGMKRLRLFFLALVVYGIVLMFPWVGAGLLRWVMSLGGVLVARYGQEAFWLGLLGLAALGVHTLAESWQRGMRWRSARAFLYGAAWYYVLSWVVMTKHFTLFWPAVYRHLARVELLACLPILLVVAVPRRKPWTRSAVLGFLGVILALSALPTALPRYFSGRDLTTDPPPIVDAMLRKGAGEAGTRMSGARYANDYLADLCPDQNLLWGLSDIRLTNPIILRRYAAFAQHWNTANIYMTTCYLPRQDAGLLRFLGVRWTVRDSKRPDPDLPVRVEVPPLVLQEVTNSPSWVRAVGEWELASNEPDEFRRTFSAIRTGGWRERVVLDGKPTRVSSAGKPWRQPTIEWVEKGPDRWSWKVSGPDPSILVILMNAHPGWRARVDEKPARLFRAYASFMAMEIPGGTHEVTLKFHDRWFLAGLVVTLMGWIVLGTWIVVVGRRRMSRGGDAGTPPKARGKA